MRSPSDQTENCCDAISLLSKEYTMVRLHIFSDPICPWCNIWKTHLAQAIKQTVTSFFDIRWHPFQLKPDMPPEGFDQRNYLKKIWRSSWCDQSLYIRISTRRGCRIKHNFEAIKKTPNTLNAHLMIHWSEAEGQQDEIVSALFTAIFQKVATWTSQNSFARLPPLQVWKRRLLKDY